MLSLFLLGGGFGQEARDIHDEALVGAAADLAPVVIGDDGEHEPPAVDLHKLALAADDASKRGGGAVRDLQRGADGAVFSISAAMAGVAYT